MKNSEKSIFRLLVEDYQALFVGYDINRIEAKQQIGKGWFPLGDTLSRLILVLPEPIKIDSITKKNGRLNVVVSGYGVEHKDFISGVVRMGAALSEIICEECGQQGRRFNVTAISARCKNHGGTPLRLPTKKRKSQIGSSSWKH